MIVTPGMTGTMQPIHTIGNLGLNLGNIATFLKNVIEVTTVSTGISGATGNIHKRLGNFGSMPINGTTAKNQLKGITDTRSKTGRMQNILFIERIVTGGFSGRNLTTHTVQNVKTGISARTRFFAC